MKLWPVRKEKGKGNEINFYSFTVLANVCCVQHRKEKKEKKINLFSFHLISASPFPVPPSFGLQI